MEILFITHKYPPSIGGMEKQSYQLIKGISKKHRVRTIIYQKGEESKIVFFLKLKWRVNRMLKKYPNIQLIHLNDGLMAAMASWVIDFKKIPVVATFHGLDVVFPMKLYQKIIIPRMHLLSAAIAVSSSTANELLKRGFDPNKVYTINNGVDFNLENFKLKPTFYKKIEKKINCSLQGKKILVTMGRPVKRKGFSWFVKNVLPSLPEDCILLIIGPGSRKSILRRKIWNILPKKVRGSLALFLGMTTDYEDMIQAMENKLVKNRVWHLGEISFPEVLQTLTLADLFIMPNIKVKGDMEGFGLVALESCIRSTPVLASDIDGITDAVHDNRNGFLVKAEDVEEWTYRIYQLINNTDSLASFGVSAMNYTKATFNWEYMTTDYAAVFRLILRKKENYAKTLIPEDKRSILNVKTHKYT